MDFRYEDQQKREQLLSIVDRGTAEQLFTFLQNFHRKPFERLTDVMTYIGVIDDQIDIIDCTGTRYDVTPLIIAAGKGSFEKTKILLVHGANPNKQCSTGDTALNLAVHRQKYPIVDLLLQYRANPNLYNQSGKTALHRAVVSYNEEHIHHIRALLNAGADPRIEDRNQRIPLDDAVIANRPDVLDILLSHDPTLIQRSYRAAIIASRLGHDKCLEILLNYGMNPNITDQTNITPLHVAVRSVKLSTTQLLLAYGADPNIENNRGETALHIAEYIQPDQQQNFINVLIHTPEIASSTLRSHTIDDPISYTYPILRNHQNWTLDNDEFRSQTAPNSSVQHLLDSSTETCWCSTQSTNAWIIFDLKHEFKITGLRIIGCDNESTPKDGHLDVSNAIHGPWLTVKDFTCLLSYGNKNDFFFPPLKTRFIRVFILNNYGGDDIQIQSINFYGVDMRLVKLLQEYKLENSLVTLLANGINDQETLEQNQDEILNSSDKYLHINDHFQFMRLTDALKSPQLTFLEWCEPPSTTAIAGEKLRTFSVIANAGVTERVKLEEKLDNHVQSIIVVMKDLEPIQGYSLVDFSDYIIKYPGRYKIRVASAEMPHIHTSWQDIVVGTASSYSSKLNTAVDEHLYLSSTTCLSNVTSIDKEYTLLLQKKPTATPTVRENRAFIITVYESENEDTDDDTYLTSLKSIEDPPYYFPITNMVHTTMNPYDNYQDADSYKPDHTTHTDDDYDDDSDNPAYSRYISKQDKFLTPEVYRKGQRPALTSLFPKNNIDDQNQSSDDDTYERIIIPTKYKLLEMRINKLRNDEKENYVRTSPNKNKQYDTSTNQDRLSSQQQNYSKYEKRDQLEDQNQSIHDQRQSQQRYQSPKDQQNQVQNGYGSDDDKSQQNKSSHHYHSGTQLHNRNESEKDTSLHQPSRSRSQSQLATSPKQTSKNSSYYGDKQISSQQHQSSININNVDENYSNTLNQYTILSGDFQLIRRTPTDDSSYNDETKRTQLELILRATVQGPDAQERSGQSTNNLSNVNRESTTDKSLYPHGHQSYNDANNYQEKPDRSSRADFTSHNVQSPITTTESQHHPHTTPVNRPVSQHTSSPSSKYDEKNSQHKDDTHGSALVISRSPPKKPAAHTKQYYFGEKIQNQVSDEETDESECVAFGNNPRFKPNIRTSAKRNLDHAYPSNSRSSTNDQNYSYSANTQFEQQSDVGTTTKNSMTQPKQYASNSNQSTIGKNPDHPYQPSTVTSNNRTITTQNVYDTASSHAPSNTYYTKNQSMQYHGDADNYKANMEHYNNQQASSSAFTRNIHDDDDDDDDDRQSDVEPVIHNRNQDNLYQNAGIDNGDDNDDDGNFRGENEYEESVSHQSGVRAIVTQNPVRNIRENLSPTQYPAPYSDPNARPPVDQKKKSLFGSVFSKSKNKDDDTNKSKSSKQKSTSKTTKR